MNRKLWIIWICFGGILLIGCGDEGEETSGAPESEAPKEGEPAKEVPPAAENDRPEETKEEKAIPAQVEETEEENEEGDPMIPTEGECADALRAVGNFGESLGLKPPKKKERNQFLEQCLQWPRDAVQCLTRASEPDAVLECMKPISEFEMRREIQKAKATLPGNGDASKLLAPKKVKDSGGAAARRLKSFKKAVGKE